MKALICIYLFSIVLLYSTTNGAKILVLIMQFGGHISEVAPILRSLHEMGHESYIVVDRYLARDHRYLESGAKFITYDSPDPLMADHDEFSKKISKAIENPNEDILWKTAHQPRIKYDCYYMLHDEKFITKVKNHKFDIAMVDSLMFCFHLLPYKLQIPIVGVSNVVYTFQNRLHPLINGLLPCIQNVQPNTFWNRLNLAYLNYQLENLHEKCLPDEDGTFLNYIPNRNFSSLYELARENTLLWIVSRDPFITDCPVPSYPNIIHAFGTGNEDPKPLPVELKEFADSAENGIVIVSFGSLIKMIPRQMLERLADAFKNIENKVLLNTKIEDKNSDIKFSKNVLIKNWVPLKDLLGHRNSKLFISHCGLNSMHESVSRGIPIICIPIYGDQFYNSLVVTSKGFGVSLDRNTFTAKDLVASMNEVIKNPVYKQNIRNTQEIVMSLPKGDDVASFWIDHVIKYGGKHLKSAAQNLSPIQFYMIDIFCLVFGVLFTSLFIIVLVVFKCCFRSKNDKPKLE